MLAIFNPDVPQPAGGFCISVFLVFKKDSTILVGKIANEDRWSEKWGLDLHHRERWQGKWQIPATFLEIGESPMDTAKRICDDQLGLRNYLISNPRFFTASGPSSVRPGTNHSDLMFVYDAEYSDTALSSENFSELHYEPQSNLSALKFGRGHDEVLHLCAIY